MLSNVTASYVNALRGGTLATYRALVVPPAVPGFSRGLAEFSLLSNGQVRVGMNFRRGNADRPVDFVTVKPNPRDFTQAIICSSTIRNRAVAAGYLETALELASKGDLETHR